MSDFTTKSVDGPDNLVQEAELHLARIEEIKNEIGNSWDNINNPEQFLTGIPVLEMID